MIATIAQVSTRAVRLAGKSAPSRRFQAIDSASSAAEHGAVVAELGRVFAEWADLEVRPEVSGLVNG